METEERITLFKDVFAPKNGEKVLFLIDKPHDNIVDNQVWQDRREMANEWYNCFKDIGHKEGFSVEIKEYDATGVHNTPIPQQAIDAAEQADLVIAMTEYSGTCSLYPMVRKEGCKTRGASMPGVEKRMEETAMKANYKDIKIYADNIQKMLNKAVGAEILFITGDKLFLDLRNRNGSADTGECTKPGQFINFPSGEACISPYEGVSDEVEKFGESKTEGILPDNQHGDLIKYKVKNNKIVEVLGEGENVEKMQRFFELDDSHRNIAELGVGCNPKAVVTGNILEDEKVSGLHIAYGMSTHLGGKIKSDMHQDICFPKGLEGAAKTLTLFNEDGSKIELITDSQLNYDLLK